MACVSLISRVSIFTGPSLTDSCVNSIDPLPTSRFGSDSETARVQDQRIVQIKRRAELFEKEIGRKRRGWAIFICQQRFCARIGRGCWQSLQSKICSPFHLTIELREQAGNKKGRLKY